MANVDPYVVQIPAKITNPDGSPAREFLDWLHYDNRWKHDIWIKSGGGTDSINYTNTTLGASDTTLTTTEKQFIRCLNTSPATITLNSVPVDGEEVIFWVTNNQVTISGTINGDSSLIVPKVGGFYYHGVHLRYSSDAAGWAII